MENFIPADRILDGYTQIFYNESGDSLGTAYDAADTVNAMIEYGRQCVKLALQEASEKTSLIEIGYNNDENDFIENGMGDLYSIDRQSILDLENELLNKLI